MSVFKARDDKDVLDAVSWAVSEKAPLELFCGGNQRPLGRAIQASNSLDMSALAGIRLYEPAELVLGAGPGTARQTILQALDAANQMMAFEPVDLGPLYGRALGQGSIGGIFSLNLAGPRRLKAGAARDHLLGFHAVSGRAEVFKSGGRVVKNVTGYDLSKLMVGSFGTFAAFTEVTFKVMPKPEKTWTALAYGLNAGEATKAMSAAMNSPHEVSSAGFVPAGLVAQSSVSHISSRGQSVTAIRIEGPGPSVAERVMEIRKMLSEFGPTEELHSMNSNQFWAEMRDALYLVEPMESAVWRISVPPREGASIVAAIAQKHQIRYFLDWSGGLIWLSVAAGKDAAATDIRASFAACGGHATLIRGPADVRAAVPVFQPLEASGLALSQRIKASFDPENILNPGRMHKDI
jgi:glycolate oxidase FAD binding subunit